MGKNEFLTPKAIANRIKAKGLQKLRWYCQMCQKQCRDENGFKCHCMSESHQRQMQIFGQNPHRIVEGYSEEFENSFLDLMRRAHRFSRVAATVVYNEYIHDRHHVHMNSTQWATLTEFVKYLGKTGKLKVEDTPKGWFITYIDRDSETLFKEREKNKRIRADMVEEEKQEREIQKQIEKVSSLKAHNSEASVQGGEQGNDNGNGVNRIDEGIIREAGEKVGFSLAKEKADNPGPGSSSRVIFEGFDSESDRKKRKGEAGDDVNNGGDIRKGRGKSVIEELMEEEEKKKEKFNRKDYWLYEGIVVKVMSKALAGNGYYKQKGVVKKVIDKYIGEIEMIETKHVLRVDQEELETVIPQIGGLVRIVNGAYRGELARLLSINTDMFCAKVEIEKGVYEGRVLPAIEYEDICKVVL
ncbi:hypothetical protein MLD38_032569 [Melastoma candidum]|uniref:Uncharacterized protein n=2 Tax=Melastoma candidum TaxID=119954 RepID=A0ACB9M5B2_9MYRT|nr:hypothetical protein MLD38_032569 [Melastoma candidum]